MVIKSIYLKNFMSFEGNITIDFPKNSLNQITVIEAERASGKTTLLEALNWCICGKPFFDKKQFLNVEVAERLLNNQTATLEVIVDFTIGNDEPIIYRVKRTQTYKKENNLITLSNENVEATTQDETGRRVLFLHEFSPVRERNIQKLFNPLLRFVLSSGGVLGLYKEFTKKHSLDMLLSLHPRLNTMASMLKHLGYDANRSTVIGELGQRINFSSGTLQLKGNEKLLQNNEYLRMMNSKLSALNDAILDYEKCLDSYLSKLKETPIYYSLYNRKIDIEKKINSLKRKKDSVGLADAKLELEHIDSFLLKENAQIAEIVIHIKDYKEIIKKTNSQICEIQKNIRNIESDNAEIRKYLLSFDKKHIASTKLSDCYEYAIAIRDLIKNTWIDSEYELVGKLEAKANFYLEKLGVNDICIDIDNDRKINIIEKNDIRNNIVSNVSYEKEILISLALLFAFNSMYSSVEPLCIGDEYFEFSDSDNSPLLIENIFSIISDEKIFPLCEMIKKYNGQKILLLTSKELSKVLPHLKDDTVCKYKFEQISDVCIKVWREGDL